VVLTVLGGFLFLLNRIDSKEGVIETRIRTRIGALRLMLIGAVWMLIISTVLMLFGIDDTVVESCGVRAFH
jgi:hypothetical protein